MQHLFNISYVNVSETILQPVFCVTAIFYMQHQTAEIGFSIISLCNDTVSVKKNNLLFWRSFRLKVNSCKINRNWTIVGILMHVTRKTNVNVRLGTTKTVNRSRASLVLNEITSMCIAFRPLENKQYSCQQQWFQCYLNNIHHHFTLSIRLGKISYYSVVIET